MAEKIKTVIFYRLILSSKRTLPLKGEVHRHMETTRQIRGKAQKKKRLFAATMQVVIQSMDSSAHNFTSVPVASQDHAIPRFLFGELCSELFASSGGHF